MLECCDLSRLLEVDTAGSDAVLGRTLGLFDRLRDAVAWKDSINTLIEPLINHPSANQSARKIATYDPRKIRYQRAITL